MKSLHGVIMWGRGQINVARGEPLSCLTKGRTSDGERTGCKPADQRVPAAWPGFFV